MKDVLFGLLVTLLPKNLLSYLVGQLVHLRLPPSLARRSLVWFANHYQIDVEEAEKPLSAYPSIGAFFSRSLKPGLRPIEDGFVHPVDGNLTVLGRVREGDLIQAKGKKYSTHDFLGIDPSMRNPQNQTGRNRQGICEDFEGGSFLTYYLCPTDYHRVHSPIKGEIVSCVHIPGRLWPVNPWAVAHVSQLFAVNERVVIWIRDPEGRHFALVMVGATNVGKMTMAFDKKIVSNQGSWKSVLRKTYSTPLSVEKGEELGTFNMGSSVVFLAPKDYFETLPNLGPHSVKYGQSMNRLLL